MQLKHVELSSIYMLRFLKLGEVWSRPCRVGACCAIHVDFEMQLSASKRNQHIWDQFSNRLCNPPMFWVYSYGWSIWTVFCVYDSYIYIYMYRVLVEGHHQLYWIYIYIVDLDWTYLDLGFQFQSYMHAFVNPSAWIFMHKFIHGDPLACQV